MKVILRRQFTTSVSIPIRDKILLKYGCTIWHLNWFTFPSVQKKGNLMNFNINRVRKHCHGVRIHTVPSIIPCKGYFSIPTLTSYVSAL